MTNSCLLSEDGTFYRVYFRDGSCFLIDREDLELISGRSWCHGKRGYPIAHFPRSDGGKSPVPVHRIIMNPPEGFDVDHISGDKLDNRRRNLRICSHQQNMFNQHIRCTNTTGYRGVSFSKAAGKYEAYINLDGRKIHLGLFTSAKDASIARDRAAQRLYGEYASLNEAV